MKYVWVFVFLNFFVFYAQADTVREQRIDSRGIYVLFSPNRGLEITNDQLAAQTFLSGETAALRWVRTQLQGSSEDDFENRLVLNTRNGKFSELTFINP